jgi:methionyl-tRNA formyltransferase
MTVVFLVRAPRWYSFRGDRLTRQIQERGHTVAAFVVEPVSTAKFIVDSAVKFGPAMLVRKSLRIAGRVAGRNKGPVTDFGGVAVSQASRTTVPAVYCVKSHNSPECVELLRSLDPDIVFLRGCGIIRPMILAVPKVGVLNAHYGQLPKYRGVYATEWAVLHGETPTISMHFVDAGVDTGPVLATREVPLGPGSSLASLRDASSQVGADLLVDVLDGLERGTIQQIPQNPLEGRQYFTMHPRIRDIAERRLKAPQCR